MTINFSKIDLSQFRTKKIRRTLHYRLNFEYIVELGAREGVLRVRAMVGNEKVGSAAFDFNKMEHGLSE